MKSRLAIIPNGAILITVKGVETLKLIAEAAAVNGCELLKNILQNCFIAVLRVRFAGYVYEHISTPLNRFFCAVESMKEANLKA